jgi:hypothetical protein
MIVYMVGPNDTTAIAPNAIQPRRVVGSFEGSICMLTPFRLGRSTGSEAGGRVL